MNPDEITQFQTQPAGIFSATTTPGAVVGGPQTPPQPATQVATTVDPFVRRGQTFLKEAGFDPGPIDGIMGPQTSAGISQFQTSANIPVTGQFDQATRQAIANFQMPQVPTPSLDTTVDVSQIEGAVPSPIQVQQPSPRSQLAARELAAAETYAESLTPILTQLTQAADDTTQFIRDLMARPGEEATRMSIEEERGRAELASQLGDLQGKINQELAGLRASQDALEAEGAVRSTAGLTRRQAQLERQSSNRILAYQAAADVLQGKIDNIDDYATRMAAIQTEENRSLLEASIFNLEQIQKEAESVGDDVRARQAEARLFQREQELAEIEARESDLVDAKKLIAEALQKKVISAAEASRLMTSGAGTTELLGDPRIAQALQTPTEAEALDMQATRMGIALDQARLNALEAENAISQAGGVLTPEIMSQLDFSDPQVVNALPMSDLSKAVMNGIVKLSELTPTQKGEVAGELNAIGFDPDSYLIPKFQELLSLYEQIPQNLRGLGGVVPSGVLTTLGTQNAEVVAAFQSLRNILTREIARLNDVGVLSDQDVKAYTDSMPSRWDENIDIATAKVNGLLSSRGVSVPTQQDVPVQTTPSGLQYQIIE